MALINNLAVYASNGNPAHLGCVRGISVAATVADATALIRVYGPMLEPSFSFVPGPIFVGLNGSLTQTPPTTGWLQQIAVADSPTQIFVDPQPPIDLGN
ncbi:hypothetical protein [Anatilimnocola floriformis]|uniref:hypothetical protein n=1 Tax=Anatilimnocola floriformis TaxID=2948575 RepID=UPI0020C1D498|nr:hypothetical protein [Anatilimnocola floriformis]